MYILIFLDFLIFEIFKLVLIYFNFFESPYFFKGWNFGFKIQKNVQKDVPNYVFLNPQTKTN